MPNSRHKAAIDSFPLAARTTNRIRCSLTSVLDHDIVPVLPGTKLYSPWCNGCLDITCNGCHETIQLKPRPTKLLTFPQPPSDHQRFPHRSNGRRFRCSRPESIRKIQAPS